MIELFLKIINMSISASWLVLAVLILRLVLKRAPKWINVLLWGIVAVRLICPFAIESPVSLIPDSIGSGELVSQWANDYIGDIDIHYPDSVYYDTAIGAGREPISDGEGGCYVVTKHDQLGEPSTIENTVIPVLSVVWLTGIAVLLVYTAISYWRLRRKVDTAVLYKDNIFQSENVVSPFVLGIVKPRIYLPYKMNSQALEHVIAHEQAHIRRRDHWWKPLGFLLLTIHWFNPLMWFAYVLLCRDIELACDEKVIRELGSEQRADYTQALVTCSVNHRRITTCPLAFGEVGVRERVKSVMNYQKPAFRSVILALLACVVAAVCFLTNPLTSVRNPWVQEYIPGTGNILGNADKEKFESVSGDFAIGADQYGRAVFKDPHKAFETLKELYADGITLIKEENNLLPFSRYTYDSYKNLGWQTTSGSEEVQAQASFVTNFLDIYENSFSKDTPAPGTEIPTTEPVLQEAQWVDDTGNSSAKEDTLDAAISAAILEHYAGDSPDGLVNVESHVLLANESKSGTPQIDTNNHMEEVTVYLMVLHEKYSTYGGMLDAKGGSYVPAAITFSMNESGEYTLKEYWEPRDGSYYTKDIQAKFPDTSAEDVLNDQAYIEDLQAQNYNKALSYLNSTGGLDVRIRELLDEICVSPGTASSPAQYIEAHDAEYQELQSYGEYTLTYCFSEFLSGEQTDLRGHIMAAVCEEISNAWGEALVNDSPAPATGQDWFDAFNRNARKLATQFSDEEMEKNYPASWLLLQMIDE